MEMPHNIKPMLCTLIKEPFDDEGWIFETKWDGYRAIAEISKKKVDLYSRNLNSFNDIHPEIIKDLEKIPAESAILDGEIVVIDEDGKQDFQALQDYQRLHKGKTVYCVFDLIYLNGHDLRKEPLINRKALLKQLLSNFRGSHIKYTDSIKAKGIDFFKKAEKEHLEGIIGKKADSPYLMKRSSNWVKIKTHLRQEVVIGGFTEPKGTREKFGALLVGVYEKGKLKFIGKVGGGFSEDSLLETWKILKPLEQKTSPFESESISEIKEATWVKPKAICEVSFAEWTKDGKMRQPIFKGIRTDKPAKLVHREIFTSRKK